jgi:hypothetical protein
MDVDEALDIIGTLVDRDGTGEESEAMEVIITEISDLQRNARSRPAAGG